jgi:hypothetical protein
MARSTFFPTRDSLVLDWFGTPCAGVPVRVFSRQTGGSQVTDLVAVASDGTLGAAIPGGVLISDGNGAIPAFAGPDGGSRTVWVDTGPGPSRLALTADPSGAGGGVTGSGGGAVTTTSAIAADAALTGTFAPILNAGLLGWAYAQAFRLVSATRDANGAISTATVVWPDGSTGTFTTDTASTAFPGAIDAYHVTYVNGATGTKTVTQAAVTRDLTTGAVTAQPALAVN